MRGEDGMTCIYRVLHEMGTDKAGRAGNEELH